MKAEKYIQSFLKEISHELHGMRSGLRVGVSRLIQGREAEAPEVVICDEALTRLEALVEKIDLEIEESERL